MNEAINVRIITPLHVVLQVKAKMVVMPGEQGEFGVLPGHEQLIASLSTGLIKLYINDTSHYEITYLMYNGIAEVTESKVDIITEFAIEATKLSQEEISAKIIELKTTASPLSV